MDLGNEPLSLRGNKYKVFLSLSRDEGTRKSFPVRLNSFLRKVRGEDTQESFSSCLCSSLRKAGISILKDDISIEGCKISIVIFSKHYASSKRCLQELTKIMDFHKSYDQIVLPIFYGVNPFEVQNQKYGFGRAFQRLVQKISPTEDEVLRWRRALQEVGGMDGIVVVNFEPKSHSEYIQDIVKRVLDMLVKVAADDQVAFHSQVGEVIRMLQKPTSKDIVFIGIWGMGGVGKTYIARVIYKKFKLQQIFHSSYFFSNVRDKWKDLDSVIRKATKIRIRNHNKRLLLVLDDVNHVEQLHALCGSRKWFGRGSRIIITTRDLHILRAFQVDNVYSMKLLSNNDSLQLFSRRAFQQKVPKGEFIQLSRRIVTYTEGLPLALKVLGSILMGGH